MLSCRWRSKERKRSASSDDKPVLAVTIILPPTGTSSPRSNPCTNTGIVCFSISSNSVEEEGPMSTHAGSFTGGVLAGAVYLAGSLSTSAIAESARPNFAPNASVGWYAYNRIFIPPASGAGPLQQDPGHPYVSND